jgi:hypothetical protein
MYEKAFASTRYNSRGVTSFLVKADLIGVSHSKDGALFLL